MLPPCGHSQGLSFLLRVSVRRQRGQGSANFRKWPDHKYSRLWGHAVSVATAAVSALQHLQAVCERVDVAVAMKPYGH